VTGFVEKSGSPVTNRINAGCYVFRRWVIDEIPPDRAVSVERETFPDLVEKGRMVVGYLENAYWRDVGTPEALVAASKDLVLGAVASPAMEAEPGGAQVSPAAKVADSATVNGGSLVADGVIVGDGAVVSGSVLMAGVIVESGAVIEDSVLGPGSVVGADARLVEVTVGDDALIGAGVHLGAGTRVDCGSVVSPS
jgi:mannose-1-phosphate guanylyltransferase